MKKLLCLTMILAVTVSLITGCGGDKSNEATKGDIKKVSYALTQEPETLDPTMNVYSRSSIVLQNLFRGLYKKDANNMTVPALAESYTVSEDGLTYTFTLKSDLKWSDGTPLTAGDFEYSWKRVLNPETASQAAFELYYIKNGEEYNNGAASAEDVGVKAIDDATLEVNLVNPTAYFVDLTTSSQFFPVKKDIVEAEVTWTKSADTYVCSGPFMLKEIKPQEKYVLAKNPHYVDSANVKLDELDILFIDSAEAQLVAYKNNEIQVSDGIAAVALKEYESSPELNVVPRIGTYYLDINCEKEPFDDPRVRQAFSMAIDRNVVIDNIIQSDYEPAYGFVPYGIPYGLDAEKDYREVAGDLFKADLETAKALLSEAGYPNGEGFPVVDYKTLNSTTDTDIAQALQSMWKENLGVTVEITTYESKVYWDELHNGTYNICRDGWTGDYPDPMTNLSIFHINEVSDDIRWTSEGAKEFSSLLDANKKTDDQEIRMANFIKAEQIMIDEMPAIPVYFMSNSYLAKENVTGVIKNLTGHTIFEYTDVIAQ